MSVRFRSDSPEMSCGKVLPGDVVCLRTHGHDGKCIAMMCDAAAADGVCHACRAPQTNVKALREWALSRANEITQKVGPGPFNWPFSFPESAELICLQEVLRLLDGEKP